jgi:hypothetical protein
MGLYKLCEHSGRGRDRCEHAWWARFRYVRVSLEKWSNREIKTKTEADAVLDDLRKAIRDGTFDKRSLEPPREVSPQTLARFAQVYKERHVLAKGLAIGTTTCGSPDLCWTGHHQLAPRPYFLSHKHGLDATVGSITTRPDTSWSSAPNQPRL